MPTSERQRELAKIKQRRADRENRRERMLEDVISGINRAIVAQRHGVSAKTVQREVDRALDARRPRTSDRHLRLQTERLERALHIIDHALDGGETSAVTYLIKVMEKLDYYQGMPAAAPTPAPLRIAHDSPLALTHERTEIVA